MSQLATIAMFFVGAAGIAATPVGIGWLLVAGWALSCIYAIGMIGVWPDVKERRIFAAVAIAGTLASVFWINRDNPALVDRAWLAYSLYALSALTIIRAGREFFPPSWERLPVGTSRIEQFILIALNEEPRYGFQVSKRVQELGGGYTTVVTFYTALDRLLKAGMVEPAGEVMKDGKPRKLYRTTDKGKGLIGFREARTA